MNVKLAVGFILPLKDMKKKTHSGPRIYFIKLNKLIKLMNIKLVRLNKCKYKLTTLS